MSHYHYFVPLVASLVFVTFGLYFLRAAPAGLARWRKDKSDTGPVRRTEVLSARFSGGMFFVGGSVLAVVVLFFSPLPWEQRAIVARNLRVPPDQVLSVEVLPGPTGHPSLVAAPVTIESRDAVAYIAAALNAAEGSSADKPKALWFARLRVRTAGGEVEMTVEQTNGPRNGTLLRIKEGGWAVNPFRSDALGAALESAVGRSTPAVPGGDAASEAK